MSDGLAAVLARSRDLGFLGPGDPTAHARHALGFARAYEALAGAAPIALCDLGAGGGVPGLVLADAWPTTAVHLLEAAQRRCQFLREAVAALGWADRVLIEEGRAEALARTDHLGGRFELVTSRSFGPPSVTAECAARLLAPAGVLLVAEPPEVDPQSVRWPPDGLALLGLGPAVSAWTAPHLVAIRATGSCPERFPRRDGVPRKRPLF
jgi:16S rRNA (guanine527-N7)-methyltransferase